MCIPQTVPPSIPPQLAYDSQNYTTVRLALIRVNSTDQKNVLCRSHPNPHPHWPIIPRITLPPPQLPQWPMTPRITLLLDLLLSEWTALIRVNNTDNVTKTLPSKCWQHSFRVILNVHTPNSAPLHSPPPAGLWLRVNSTDQKNPLCGSHPNPHSYIGL